MMSIIAFSMASGIADALAYGSIVALAVYGFYQGVFQSTVAAMIVLSAALGGIALAPACQPYLELCGLPVSTSLPAAFFSIVALVLTVGRLIVGAFVRSTDMRFHVFYFPLDNVLGAVMGCVAGLVLGAAMLIGWSMCELPHGYRLMAPAMSFDSGCKLLWAFVRCVEPNPREQQRLFHGDVFRAGGAEDEGAGELLRVSEPFEDVDGNWRWDDGEPYLDYDRNGKFTMSQLVVDHPSGKPGARDIGLSDCYWLSSWRRIRVLHAPKIGTKDIIELARVPSLGEFVTRIVASDPDEGDKLQFSIQKNKDDDASCLIINADSGNLHINPAGVLPSKNKIRFSVSVVDRSGFIESKDFTLVIRASR